MSPVELEHPLLSWWSARRPEVEGAMVEGGCSPISEEEPGFVVEIPHYLQVAPFPKKLLRH